MAGHNHMLQSLRTALFLTPPGPARDMLAAIRQALWADNAEAMGEKIAPVSVPDLARARRLARAAGHRLMSWELQPSDKTMHCAVCRDCKMPLFVYPGGFSPLYPCTYKPRTKGGAVRYKRTTFGRW